MKKFYLILIFLSFLFQFSFLPRFNLGFQDPNLILIAATIIGIKKISTENIGWFILAGLIFEFFSAEDFGFNLFVFLLTGVIVWFFRNIILNKESNLLIDFTFWSLVKLIYDLVYSLIAKVNSLIGVDFFYYEINFISMAYVKEFLFFVFCGIITTIFWNFFENGIKLPQNSLNI